jgi:ABC-type uncharacterized transport system involved in gliding motility auxiliary subunit
MGRWWFAVWVVALALLLMSSAALWIVSPEYTVLNLCVSVFTLLLGVLLFYPRRTDFLTWIQSRQGKNSFIHVTRFGIYALLVALVSYLAWKFPLQVDTSERALSTLSAQSQRILAELPVGTKLTLYARRQEWPRPMALLKLYRDTRRDIILDAVDPEVRPEAARSAGVQDPMTVVVESGDKRASFVLSDELSVTNALLRMIRERRVRVYLTWGHGEPTCDSMAAEGVSAFCQHLKSQNYEVHKLDLQTSSEVPATADVVVIWGAQSGMLAQEIQRLQRYLEKGGSLLWLYGPQFQTDHLLALRELMAKWGLIARNDLVVDSLSSVETQEATIPLISRYDNRHPITRGFQSRTVFPLTSSIALGEPLYDAVATTALAFTSDFPGSWAETDLYAVSQGKASFTEKKDFKGPVAIAAVAERLPQVGGSNDARVAVVGNDAFARNAYQNQTANMNFLLNIVGWLSHDEGLVSLNRPGLSHEPIVLSDRHLHFVFFLTVVTIPLIAFVLALLVFRRRRKL